MITDLTPFIEQVRLGLHSLPQQYCSDSIILFSLARSLRFVNQIKRPEITDDSLLTDGIISLTIYKTYRDYLSRSSDKEGTLSEAKAFMLQSYKEDAISVLSLISKYALGEDLIPEILTDEGETARPIAFVPWRSMA